MWLLEVTHTEFHLWLTMLYHVRLAKILMGVARLAEIILFGACLSLLLTLSESRLEYGWTRISPLIEGKLWVRLVHLMNLLWEGLLCLTKCVLRILRQSTTTVMCTTSLVIETAVRVDHLLLLLLHVASLAQSHLLHLQFRNHHLR